MSLIDTLSSAFSGLESSLSGLLSSNETRYFFSVPAVNATLQVLRFDIQEQLNEPWCLNVTVVTENDALKPEQLIHQEMTLTLTRSTGKSYYHGQVWQCKKKAQGKRLTQYELICKPPIAWLGLGQNQRIFQNLTESDIIKKILLEQRIPADRVVWKLTDIYQPREYCVQYQESDLTFITRLCTEAGFYFYFQHSEQKSVLVFGDHPSAWLNDIAAVEYKPGNGQANESDTIQSLMLQQQVGTQSFSHRQFDFQKPQHPQDTKQQPQNNNLTPDYLEHYQFKSGNKATAQATTLTSKHLQAKQNVQLQLTGWGNLPQLRTGELLTVSGHPRAAVNRSWAMIQLSMQGEQPQVLEEFSSGQSSITCHFSAIPSDQFWRPAMQPHKPLLKGLQTAMVTGPAGEEIYTDALGRIKVQFHWDREGKQNEQTSCWLRVMHDWAGDGYGVARLPRIGQEVQVSFEEGDLDKPLVTGMYHHAEQPVAWEQPKHKTRSGIRTSSTPGGVGTNEMRFEDKKGQEELRWQAQQDWDVLVNAESHTQIDGNHERKICGDDYREIQGEQHIRLEANHQKSISENQHTTIHGSFEQHLEQKSLIQANQSMSWKSDTHAIFHAGTEMTLKAGGSFIKLDPSGVTLSGPVVTLNQGGSALSAGNEAAELPTKPAGVHASGIGKVPEARAPEPVKEDETNEPPIWFSR